MVVEVKNQLNSLIDTKLLQYMTKEDEQNFESNTEQSLKQGLEEMVNEVNRTNDENTRKLQATLQAFGTQIYAILESSL